MSIESEVLGLTPITCRWLPCTAVLDPAARNDFCSDSHRVRAAQEAGRLRDLLVELQKPGELSARVVEGLPAREREGHLRRLRTKIRHRLATLRPDDLAARAVGGEA